MGRYSGTLHKLCDAGASKKGNWNQLLTYLEVHSMTDPMVKNPKFDSPLPPFTAPTDDLYEELMDTQGPRREETPLRILSSRSQTPSHIIAALCQLGPEAARLADSRDRLPLHWACRVRPTNDKDSERVLRILATCYPEGLLHRDDGGRTPLHYLFWYHASTRTTRIVEVFLQTLPRAAFVGLKQPPENNNSTLPPLPEIPSPNMNSDAIEKIPCHAGIVHDSRNGCLPLHYAVMEGAPRDVIKQLLLAYPQSKMIGDRKGRTALAWYLGAGELGNKVSPVCGEKPDPNAIPWWKQKISVNIANLLLNSKVARTGDDTGRYPLHWACHMLARQHYQGPDADTTTVDTARLSLKVVQLLLDNHVEALTTQDNAGNTPLHVLFDVVAELQQQEWTRISHNKLVRDDIDLTKGGKGGAFSPPVELVENLLRHPQTDTALPTHAGERPPCAAHFEDPVGRLPLHLALSTSADPVLIQMLVQANPTSLVHTTDELVQTPLHVALSSPYTTPMQVGQTIHILLQAYVTSRHGTFVNGRLALKMEDANGMYPLHLACQNQACLEVTKMVFERYPKSALFTSGEGDLPLHSLLSREHFFGTTEGTQVLTGASLATPMGWTSASEEAKRREELRVVQQKLSLLLEAVTQEDKALQIASSAHGLLPLHIAVAFDALPYSSLYTILVRYTAAATKMTTAEGHVYSAMDLHEMRRPALEHDDEKAEVKWHMVRELLFAFGPILEPHRHTDELLEQCAKVVRDEVLGLESAHVTAQLEWQRKERGASELQIQETISSIKAPEFEGRTKPKTARQPKQRRPLQSPAARDDISLSTVETPRKPKTPKRPPSPPKTQKKSIYDDDDGHGYVVTPEGSFDDDDDDYFSDEVQEDEAYDPDEYDPRYDDEFDEETKENVQARTNDDDTWTYDDESRTYDSRTHASKTIASKAYDDDTRTYDSRTFDGRTFDETTTFDDETHDGTKGGRAARLTKSGSSTGVEEEKKEDEQKDDHLETPFLSDVALRIWTFFTLFRNKDAVRDHYAKQVDLVIDELPFPKIVELVSLTLPEFATSYVEIGEDARATTTFRDVAYNACKAMIHKAFHFGGRFEFRAEPTQNLMLHRTNDGDIVVIRAIEHIVQTENVIQHVAEPGTIEAAIWETGQTPEEQKETVESTFRVTAKPVCFKLMRSREAFEREVMTRKELGVSVEGVLDDARYVVPLIAHFNAKAQQSSADRRYGLDIVDERFKSIDMGEAGMLSLPEYPYAVVMPYREGGDLFDHFLHHGTFTKQEICDIGLQVGRSLKNMHKKAFVHGNLSMSKIVSAENVEEGSSGTYWMLKDLTSACKQGSDGSFLAGISAGGAVNFASSTFPPELFVKLSPSELKAYNSYWETVKTACGATLDESVIVPHIDPMTGDSYVLRCHYILEEGMDVDLPPLPYKLVPARQTSDIWAFGLLLYTFCSSGHAIFPINMKTGHLMAYDQVANWSPDKTRELVYKHVADPLAQDILLHILSGYEERAALKMDAVLCHPYFSTQEADENIDKIMQHIVELRSKESVAYKRQLQQASVTQAAGEWVSHRTKEVMVWDMDLLKRMYMAPSNLLREIFAQGVKAPDIPFGALLLPYKLIRNKSGRLTPATKKDVERAERMGIMLLSLCKVCHFGLMMHTVAAKVENEYKKWTSSELVEAMVLPSEYKELENEMVTMAAKEIEYFRDDPMIVGRKMIEQRIQELAKCFEESNQAYLYLVDEYNCIPVVDPSRVYPFEIRDRLLQVLEHTLPLMYLCVLSARGVSGGVAGLVKLIFEAAYPHIPPSWAAAASGLTHTLDKAMMESEVKLLRAASVELFASKGTSGMDDMRFHQTYLELLDKKNTYADLKRVTNGEAAIWTTDIGVEKIEKMADSTHFKDACEKDDAMRRKMKHQEDKIKQLEKKVESLEFRLKHNLGFSTL